MGPGVCSSQQEVEGSHKVLYYRPTKNERIIYYSHLFGFLFTKQQQERKTQEADEPGTGVRVRRGPGDEGRLLLGTGTWQAGPGSPSTWESCDSPGAGRGGGGTPRVWGTAVPRSAAAPFLWRPPRQSAGLEAWGHPCPEAWLPNTGPRGPGRREAAGRACTGTSSIRVLPGPPGPGGQEHQGSFLLVRQSASS